MTQSEITPYESAQYADPNPGTRRVLTATGLSVLTVVTGVLVVLAFLH